MIFRVYIEAHTHIYTRKRERRELLHMCMYIHMKKRGRGRRKGARALGCAVVTARAQIPRRSCVRSEGGGRIFASSQLLQIRSSLYTRACLPVPLCMRACESFVRAHTLCRAHGPYAHFNLHEISSSPRFLVTLPLCSCFLSLSCALTVVYVRIRRRYIRTF